MPRRNFEFALCLSERGFYTLLPSRSGVYQSLGDRLKCSFIVMLHKYIICFDLDMYFLIDSNMSTTVVAINKHMHLVKFYNFAVINCKYYNSLKSYIHLKFTAF